MSLQQALARLPPWRLPTPNTRASARAVPASTSGNLGALLASQAASPASRLAVNPPPRELLPNLPAYHVTDYAPAERPGAAAWLRHPAHAPPLMPLRLPPRLQGRLRALHVRHACSSGAQLKESHIATAHPQHHQQALHQSAWLGYNLISKRRQASARTRGHDNAGPSQAHLFGHQTHPSRSGPTLNTGTPTPSCAGMSLVTLSPSASTQAPLPYPVQACPKRPSLPLPQHRHPYPILCRHIPFTPPA